MAMKVDGITLVIVLVTKLQASCTGVACVCKLQPMHSNQACALDGLLSQLLYAAGRVLHGQERRFAVFHQQMDVLPLFPPNCRTWCCWVVVMPTLRCCGSGGTGQCLASSSPLSHETYTHLTREHTHWLPDPSDCCRGVSACLQLASPCWHMPLGRHRQQPDKLH